MNTELEDALRTALRAHTDDLTARPTLLADVRRGSIRRRRRRRAAAAAAVSVTVLAAGGAAVLPRPWSGGPAVPSGSLPAADRALLSRPTGGDLAGDADYRRRAVAAWNRSHRTSINADRGIFDDLTGQPRVVWAGRTPAGPAAVVVQVAYLRAHTDLQIDREGPALLWGFVGTDADGAAAVTADGYPVPGAPRVLAAFVDPGRRVLVVFDRGRPVQLSVGRRYYPDGRVRRQWQPVPFSGGAAVRSLPAGTAPDQVRLRYGDGDAGGLEIGNVPGDGGDHPDLRLQWGDGTDGRAVWPIGTDPTAGWRGAAPGWPAVDDAMEAALAGRVPSQYPDVTLSSGSLWFGYGTTADGSRLAVGEHALDQDPSRVYAVLWSAGGAVTVSARRVDRGAVLPVMVPLPRGQGWVVARKGAVLEYRTGPAGRWQDAGRDAALLPAAATEARADGQPVRLRSGPP